MTTSQMVEVDRVMVEDLGITLLQMMENAGRNLARATIDLFDPVRVSVVCGSGGNGGGGMVAARHLANAGLEVQVTLTREPEELSGVPRTQLRILERMGVEIANEVGPCDVAIDAIIGYSLQGTPTGRSTELIGAVNQAGNVLSLDVPSGLDATSGEAPGTAVQADATLTLCLPKTGLRRSPLVGRLLVADISVPPSVTSPLGGAPDFRPGPVLEISPQGTEAGRA